MKKIRYIAPSWDVIESYLIKIADDIKRSGFVPEVIVGVSRGGLPPARIISDLLDNPNLASVKVSFYLDVYKTKEEPRIDQPVSSSVRGRKVLVVDDVADSGKSLKLVKEHLIKEGASEVKIATIYYKPWSSLKPDYFAETTDAWVCFPWEKREFISMISKKLREEGKSFEEIEKQLIEIGLKPSIVKKFLGDFVSP